MSQGGAAPAAAAAPAGAPAATSVTATPPAQPAAPAAPQNLFQLAQQQQQQAQPHGGDLGGAAAAAAAARQPGQMPNGSFVIPVNASGRIDVATMSQQPQIQQLRQIMQQNPATIQPILQTIAAQNPQVIQLFAQDPEGIAQVLGIDAAQMGELADLGALAGALGGDGMDIELSEEEAAAVQRVRALSYCLFIRKLT